MRTVLSLLCLTLVLPDAHAQEHAKRRLLVAGGGALPEQVWNMFIQMGGGTNKQFLVVPHASARENAGDRIVERLSELGVRHTSILDLNSPQHAKNAIRQADAIWVGGGSQSRLIEALDNAKVSGLIRERARAGVAIGGSSAGAAVQSDLMIAGDTLPIARGLALWPEVIVDQHFVARKRFNRSLRTIMDHPTKLGIGIDEGTAALVGEKSFTVIGDSTITVIDARKATRISPGKTNSWRDIRIHWLHSGEEFKFEK